MNHRQNYYSISRFILWVTLGLMVVLLSVKVSTGWEIQSLSLLSEALHTLITCWSLLFGWLTITSPDRPTGREIYGHGRRESVFVLISVAVVSVCWLGLLFFCLQQFLGAWRNDLPFAVQANLSRLQFLGAIVAATLGLGLLNRIQSRVCRSPILYFNANQLFKDAGLMGVTIASLMGVWWGEPLFDLLAAVIVLILAVEGFWQVVVWHFPLLIEQTAIAPEVLEHAIADIEGVSRCYSIRSRGVIGRLVYISIHLVLEPGNPKLAPQIVRNIEQVLRDRYGPVQITCTIEHSSR